LCVLLAAGWPNWEELGSWGPVYPARSIDLESFWACRFAERFALGFEQFRVRGRGSHSRTVPVRFCGTV
jgi:hypothetical protein